MQKPQVVLVVVVMLGVGLRVGVVVVLGLVAVLIEVVILNPVDVAPRSQGHSSERPMGSCVHTRPCAACRPIFALVSKKLPVMSNPTNDSMVQAIVATLAGLQF